MGFANWQGTAKLITATLGQPAANPVGNFVLGQTGYIAFRQNGGSHYYGWLRVKVDGSNGRPNSIEFVSVGGSIGEFGSASDDLHTFGNGSAVPEPSSTVTGLAFLALGAAGLR
jgi:hypothetical protein